MNQAVFGKCHDRRGVKFEGGKPAWVQSKLRIGMLFRYRTWTARWYADTKEMVNLRLAKPCPSVDFIEGEECAQAGIGPW